MTPYALIFARSLSHKVRLSLSVENVVGYNLSGAKRLTVLGVNGCRIPHIIWRIAEIEHNTLGHESGILALI